MGTQQILLIVLSVIIVGVAIAVGISMFNSQAYNSNKTAIASDAQSFATQVVQYYKTPTSQGGAGGVIVDDAAGLTAICGYMGFDPTTHQISNENGIFTIDIASATSVTITGLGTAQKGNPAVQPKIVTTVTLPAGTITANASDQAVGS
ncbi:hypothetical protein MASR1M36_20900 [Candidatus Cloacimonadaceae bacterium]